MGAHTALHADEVTIQRIATARATKAVRLMWALMSTGDVITLAYLDAMTPADQLAMVERSGVKVASALTWKVVRASVESITQAANSIGRPSDD